MHDMRSFIVAYLLSAAGRVANSFTVIWPHGKPLNQLLLPTTDPSPTRLQFARGFDRAKSTGGGFGKPSTVRKNKKSKGKKRGASSTTAKPKPYVKSEQDELLQNLAQQSSTTPLGRVVSEANDLDDPFWQLMPSLISSRFPSIKNDQLERIASFVDYSFLKGTTPAQRPNDWEDRSHRPYEDLHAYMPGLGPTQPFRDATAFPFAKQLEDNYETILQEYEALVQSNYTHLFQSVTSMNYDSGWQTLVLFYNGHRIENFPYHLCPVTTKLLEDNIPLAGRIAGFNRQQPETGIPLHTDGNNLWLTCQMGLHVPPGGAYIQVADEKREWQAGKTSACTQTGFWPCSLIMFLSPIQWYMIQRTNTKPGIRIHR